jgi:hypothetical protein
LPLPRRRPRLASRAPPGRRPTTPLRLIHGGSDTPPGRAMASSLLNF